MCGIVGYIGCQDATPIILNGLRKLEYRGYDSAGIAVLQNGKIELRRSAGKVERLVELTQAAPLQGQVGIGHTRWATHGEPSEKNAHPHFGSSGDVVVVHNGIVENYQELRAEFMAGGTIFNSDTDTETIVHLIESGLSAGLDLTGSVRRALMRLKGAHGIVVMSANEPDKIIAARLGNAGGVVVGLGEGEMFIASDITAILEQTRRVVYLEPGQIAIIRRNGLQVETLDGNAVVVEEYSVPWDAEAAEKGKYPHFMQKEIHEQAVALTDTLAGRVDFDSLQVRLPQLNLSRESACEIQKIIITACGTAAHAGMVGKMLIERIARIPVEVDIASEFRYRDPIITPGTVLLSISQSGETADTLAAMDLGRRMGLRLWSIVNVIGSQAMRMADGYITMQAGPEIGVASTKAFTAPLLDLYLLAVHLADLRGQINEAQRKELVADLRLIPDLVGQCLDLEDDVKKVACKLKDFHHALYLGRGINMPIAYEGALKLKEISYIHAEAYPAGEMKHGPIALVDKEMPVIVIAPRDPWYEKMVSQVEQVRARGGIVVAVATRGDDRMKDLADEVLWIPEVPWLLSPVITILPLQMLAYHIAVLKDLDVDKPRNLAKSVTVE